MKKPGKIILAIVLALCLVFGAVLLIDYAVGEQKQKALTTGGSSCQLSVIRYSGLVDGKPAVLLSSPAAQGRKHGVIRIGLIEGQAGSYTIAWKYRYDVTGEEDAFSYSCLTELPNGEIGLLYEQNGSPQPLNMVTYRTYSMETLLGRQPQGPLRT